MRYRNCLVFLLCCCGLAAGSAWGQPAFPGKAVHIVVPFPPGGASDAMMRMLAVRLEKTWQQPVVVDNRPGAGTVVGSGVVARAPADGYTMGLVTTSHVINAAAGRVLPYDTLKDFVPVTQLAIVPQAILARVGGSLESAEAVVTYSKAHPGKLTYATAGVGSAGHMFGELMNANLGTSLVHVPYKGSSPAEVDLLGGRIPLLIDAVAAHAEMVKSGRMRLIAMVSPQRYADYPGIPTVAESFPGVSVESFFGLVVPAGTPAPVVDQLNRDVIAALGDAQVNGRLRELGLVPVGSSASEFQAFLQREIGRWSELIRRVGLKID